MSVLSIKRLCKGQGITQKELAVRLGITPVALSKSINSDLRISTLEKIAAALGVHISELFEQPPAAVARCPHCGKSFEIELKALFDEMGAGE